MDAENDLPELRAGMRTIIGDALGEALKLIWTPPEDTPVGPDDAKDELLEELLSIAVNLSTPDEQEELCLKLERVVYKASIKDAQENPVYTCRQYYTSTVRNVTQYLSLRVGSLPNDIVGIQFASNKLTATDIVAGCKTIAPKANPRDTMRQLFARTLLDAHQDYRQNTDLALETARAIEVSCFNAVVGICKNSEEPPRRQWSSPAFVDIYNTCCGTRAVLLNPTSSVSKAYGATLIPQLLSGEINPNDLGSLTEKQLCPRATADERAEIAKRSNQKVAQKESNLFRCPHCKARRCTYRSVQLRALDEAPDYFCLCLECKMRFKGNS